ncbi:hypothetical protein GALMADRAFT_258739 [Galerina marginata CBS 339.88]|uniref:Uncharacterized protein n=1 Tax=Galerina marginata (strain CBS 339.88) TaxID=685588 RepID=A0A067S7Q6_GALM3|nr:hypothetical protein GALMADRAFT_258739 [Galerina marginata CBS 339.88]
MTTKILNESTAPKSSHHSVSCETTTRLLKMPWKKSPLVFEISRFENDRKGWTRHTPLMNWLVDFHASLIGQYGALNASLELKNPLSYFYWIKQDQSTSLSLRSHRDLYEVGSI